MTHAILGSLLLQRGPYEVNYVRCKAHKASNHELPSESIFILV